jgi:ArsR family transcriptional regulator
VKAVADIFKALADETRLRMLALLLRRGELCVCDFVAVMGIGQSKASRHLRYLLHAGLVTDRREGVWVYYRVRPDPQPDAKGVLKAVRPVLASADVAELERKLDEWEEAKLACIPCHVATAPAAARRDAR